MSKILFLFFTIVSAKSNASYLNEYRIVGGNTAKISDAPFIVSLRDAWGNHTCGGTLISSTWVVTAAHCITLAGKPSMVFAGSVNSERDKETKSFKVVSVHIHPEYNKNIKDGSDLALLQVKNSSVVPMALLNETDILKYSQQPLKVAGWGNLSENGPPAEVLQITEVPYVDQTVCESQFQKQTPKSTSHLDGTMFCAGYIEGEKDACQGDSGGPIFVYDNLKQSHVLLGVVSWGYGCARKNLSGVYTNIANLKSWIDTTIEKESL
jgi:trypsin